MASEVKYRLIIENETDGQSAPVSLPSGSRPNSQPITPESAKRKQEQGINMAGLVAVNQITPYVTQAINFSISQISMTHGSDELQRKAQTFSGLAGSVASIGIAAATTGPVGAAITAGVNVINAVISVGYNRLSIQNQRAIENENIALRKSRAGLASNRSRTGGVA